MKRKLIVILICTLCGVLCVGNLLSIAASATELGGEETAIEETVTEDETQASSGASEVVYTFLGRVWEFCEDNSTELLGIAGNVVLAILTILKAKRSKKDIDDVAKDVKAAKGSSASTLSSQDLVVSSVNGMIDGYNQMRLAYDKNEGLEEDRNRLLGAVFVQNTAILETLRTVYVNSKNLPQGVKDIVTLQYANCIKALGDDTVLLSVVEAVREKISGVGFEDHATNDPDPAEGADTSEV